MATGFTCPQCGEKDAVPHYFQIADARSLGFDFDKLTVPACMTCIDKNPDGIRARSKAILQAAHIGSILGEMGKHGDDAAIWYDNLRIRFAEVLATAENPVKLPG